MSDQKKRVALRTIPLTGGGNIEAGETVPDSCSATLVDGWERKGWVGPAKGQSRQVRKDRMIRGGDLNKPEADHAD